MPRVGAAFFGFGIVSLLIGMIAGMEMGAHQDMTLMPAHAHLNLLGWVTMGLYGAFYALTSQTYSPKLAWANFIASVAGVLVMIPALGLYLMHGMDQNYIPGIVVGEVLTVLGAILFGISVLRELLRRRA
jgi:uncharacterized membrane protein YdcZ (DUF606 family)